MKKQIAIICLFMLSLSGIKAQQTICYHFYKYVDPVTNISHSMDRYFYFHFQGIYCYWTTEKDEEHEGIFLYHYESTTKDNCDYYVYGHQTGIRPRSTYKGKHYLENGYAFEDGFLVTISDNVFKYFYVSRDKALINWRNDVYENGAFKKVIMVGEKVSAPPQQPTKPTMIE